MNDLKKKSDETKNSSDVNLYNEQQKKVNAMASAAKMEYIGSQPDSNVSKLKKFNIDTLIHRVYSVSKLFTFDYLKYPTLFKFAQIFYYIINQFS